MPKADATCVNCHVPMNLCHCSKSSCSNCGLGAGNVCECLSSKPRAPCKECPTLEKAAQVWEPAKVEVDASVFKEEDLDGLDDLDEMAFSDDE